MERAQKFQRQRQVNQKIFNRNADMKLSEIRNCCHLGAEAEKLLQQASTKFLLSNRSYFKVLKIARSIADFEESEEVKPEHIAESLQYRQRV